jgi:hypothetical protein
MIDDDSITAMSHMDVYSDRICVVYVFLAFMAAAVESPSCIKVSNVAW